MPWECRAGKLFMHHDESLLCHQGEHDSDLYSWIKQRKARKEPSQLSQNIKVVAGYLQNVSRKELEKVFSRAKKYRELVRREDGTDVAEIARDLKVSRKRATYVAGFLKYVYWNVLQLRREDDTVTIVGPPLATQDAYFDIIASAMNPRTLMNDSDSNLEF